MMRYTLSEHELRMCIYTAVERRLTNRKGHVTDTQMGKQDPWQVDIDGMVAEWAFSQLFNLKADLTVKPRSGTADFVAKDGKTVDVKATRLANGRLIATPKKAVDPCDRYALMIVDDGGATFAGWIEGAELFAEANKTDLGHGPTYAMEQNKLKGRDHG